MTAVTEALDSEGVRTAAYIAAVLLCLTAAAAERAARWSRGGSFWLALAGAVLVLGLGAELTPRFDDYARRVAWSEGWYSGRRPLQAQVILAVTVAGGLAALMGLWLLRRSRWQQLLGFVAVAYLASFLLVRAVSLHQVDAALDRHIAGELHLTSALELTGLFAVAVAAATELWRVRQSRTHDARRRIDPTGDAA